jgi:hypothetical protein
MKLRQFTVAPVRSYLRSDGEVGLGDLEQMLHQLREPSHGGKHERCVVVLWEMNKNITCD